MTTGTVISNLFFKKNIAHNSVKYLGDNFEIHGGTIKKPNCYMRLEILFYWDDFDSFTLNLVLTT